MSTASAAHLSGAQLSFSIVQTPIGRLLLASGPRGLVRIAFENEDFGRILSELEAVTGLAPIGDEAALAPAERELAEYFAGSRREFSVDLDLGLTSGFRRTVVEEMGKIPYGQTSTYGELAARAGSPLAARAVGSACATNPLPIIYPCHRVVRQGGGPGGYLGGREVKEYLLQMERQNRA
ncbi:methylated-DNA--[protein]-cysteine S-methyltransferase [Scrofimicrobium sp. R131]|uniref:Methylated-DNA--protein-cysteine methyltransferase n=1 Tax=Scrofimicrobium appendicitidis TaxID=3079930 RepID=A0AAU7V5C6_9ACTO